MWSKPWSYTEGLTIGAGLLIIGILLQMTVGAINWQRGRGYRSILPQNSLLTHDFLKFLFRDLEHQGCTRAGAPVDHEYAS